MIVCWNQGEMSWKVATGNTPPSLQFTCHRSWVAMAAIHKELIELLKHPPYQSDLFPKDSGTFRKLKESPCGWTLMSDNEVTKAERAWFSELGQTSFQERLEMSEDCCDSYVRLQWQYVKKLRRNITTFNSENEWEVEHGDQSHISKSETKPHLNNYVFVDAVVDVCEGGIENGRATVWSFWSAWGHVSNRQDNRGSTALDQKGTIRSSRNMGFYLCTSNAYEYCPTSSQIKLMQCIHLCIHFLRSSLLQLPTYLLFCRKYDGPITST